MTDQLSFFEAKTLRPTYRTRDEVERHTVSREVVYDAGRAGVFQRLAATLAENCLGGQTAGAARRRPHAA